MHSFFIQQQQTFETILTDYTREKKIISKLLIRNIRFLSSGPAKGSCLDA